MSSGRRGGFCRACIFFRWVVWFFFRCCFFSIFVLLMFLKLKHLSQPGQHGRLLHCLMSPGSGQLSDFLMYECTTGHAHSLAPPPPPSASPSVLLQLWSLTVSVCRTEKTKGKLGVGGRWVAVRTTGFRGGGRGGRHSSCMTTVKPLDQP